MRNIDGMVGPHICRLLSVFLILKKLAIRLGLKKKENETVNTILVQKYFGIGSILHTIPLIRGLREQYPQAKIIFVTFPPMASTVRMCGLADELIVIPSSTFVEFGLGLLKAVLHLRKIRAELSIDLEFFSKFTLILPVLCGTTTRMGFYMKHARPSGILNLPIHFNPHQHLQKIYFAFAGKLGIQPKADFFKNQLPPSNSFGTEGWQQRLGIREDIPFILINPNASEASTARRWKMDNYAYLIRSLARDFPHLQLILSGSPSEKEYVDSLYVQVADLGDNILNLGGKTSLEELFTLCENTKLMITNDTGPMHIASLYNTDLVAIFGPETPVLYGPINKNALVFYDYDLYCSPCLNIYDAKQSLHTEICEEISCLDQIDPVEVYKKIVVRYLSNSEDCQNG
jgi:ADP-heptose:LPS heptosyltransferase